MTNKEAKEKSIAILDFILPVGKAIVSIECEGMLSDCSHCIFFVDGICKTILKCRAEQRPDSKDVLFQIIDVSKTKPYKEAKNV